MAVPPTSPVHDKPVLRRTMRAARAAFVAGLRDGERTRLEAALGAVLAGSLPPGVVAGYKATGSEIGIGSVDRATLWPRVVPGSPLTFHAASPSDPLPVRGLGDVLQPPPDTPPSDPDIILVPLLAADRTGRRLGQGGGHYDRTLAALRARRPVFAVGIGWDMQLVETLPADPWDAPLDALATPSGWCDFERVRS